MQSSVLRTVTEYPSANVALPDIMQTIPAPNVNFLKDDQTRWNLGICGNVEVELIHDGRTSRFLTHSYAYNQAESDRWLKLLPD